MAVLVIVGYTAYYFCRTNFSVGRPSQIVELVSGGLSSAEATVALGRVATVGVLAGIIGKFAAGSVVHKLGGRWAFLLGMLGAAAATFAFGFSHSLSAFTLFWVCNRLLQAMGWPAAVRIIGSWFSAGSYGRAMGIASLSWLFGDALARAGQARLLAGGWDWHKVYFASAGGLGLVLMLCLFFLRERPVERTQAATPQPTVSLRELLRRPAFLLICVASFGFTLVNVTLSEWLPLYFTRIGLAPGLAALASSLYPALGGVSAVAFGFAGDALGTKGRTRLLILGLLLTAATLAGFLVAKGIAAPLLLVGLLGLFTGGPYAYAVGAAALDLVEAKQAAGVNGLIDGVGYLGALLAGEGVARLAVTLGWSGTFATLALVCVTAAAICAMVHRK